ncbi:hypothetical protein VBG87_07085 [Streptococcus uberis]|uniref:hypothetical protein n=1 Tax=Streptococcus uberis TaxID=1349 RepID=UPI00378949B3
MRGHFEVGKKARHHKRLWQHGFWLGTFRPGQTITLIDTAAGLTANILLMMV